MNSQELNNGLQTPKLQDYLDRIKEHDTYTKIKVNIPHNFNERITWQPFEDEIIINHVDTHIKHNNTFFNNIKDLNDLREKLIDTEDFFNSKDFYDDWTAISAVLWDINWKHYLELILLIKNNNTENIPEHLHYLISRSNTMIPLQDLLKKRRPVMIKKRWLNVLDPYLKKGKWSKEEDEFLLKKYEEYGPLWSKIASEVPRRTVDQCTKRFHEALDPEKQLKNHINWTEDEDLFLINKRNTIGTKWRTIAMDLSKALKSNRSALNCRNRWKTLINSYIKNRSDDNKAHVLLCNITINGEFEDMLKLREKLDKQNIDKTKKKENKEQKKIQKMKNKNKNKEDVSDDEDVDDDFEQPETSMEYKQFNMIENAEPSFTNMSGFLMKDNKTKYNHNSIKMSGNDGMSNVDEANNVLQWSRLTPSIAPSIASNHMDHQYEANSMAALSPGQYHMSMSPPPALGMMQTPKPYDIISSLRTTQNNITNSPPSLLSNLVSANVNNMNSILEDGNSKSESNAINKHLNKTVLQKPPSRPSSVPLNNNTTEWKFQLKQKNLTLSSGNITNEKLVKLLIEQAQLNNLKISVHQHIHNHYVPILDTSEQENNTNQTTPESTAQKCSNNSVSSGTSSTNYPTKEMNDIGGYRTRHFKQLDTLKKVPKLGSSVGVKRRGSFTGSSPQRSGSLDMSTKTVVIDNKKRKNHHASEESEAYDFFDSLMDTNNKNKANEDDEDDLYVLGFNPS